MKRDYLVIGGEFVFVDFITAISEEITAYENPTKSKEIG